MPALPIVPALLLAALSFPLPDTEGVRHTPAEFRQSKAVVFAFVSTDCPISNAYAHELARIYAAYASRGVSFYGVDSDPGVSVEKVRRQARASGFRFPVLLDRRQQLARLTGVKSTPEVALLSPAGELLYRGRVDTRLGPTLDEILAGKPVSVRFTKAAGCPIPFTDATPTFARDVAPILYQHCAICHHPGEVAPFPLLTYQDAAKRAKLIATVTASRYMPPWQPEPGYGHFQGERRLRDAYIATLRRWAEAGAPQGDPAQLPPVPHYPEGWQLGTPDMTIRMPKPFATAADGPDQYMCFVIPLHLTADKYVRALEFRPETRSVVHHALFLLDAGHIGRQLGESYPCFGTPGFLPSGALGGWTPGMQPARMPDGLQLILRKGSDLVMQIHYHPTGKPETDQSALGLYFTDRPPTKWVADIALGSHQIDIPPGARAYKVRDHFTTPVDVEAVGIIPHAHYICKEMQGWAILPDGRKQWLIRIRDWNFNWQEQYRYATPVKLPADTRLEMEFTYDNSDANPRNPNHPARRVVWGPDTTDEMAGLHVQVVPEDMDDWHELGQALWGKFMRSVGGGFYRKLN
jgi:peroxiredoxin/mono/diheme cytochrome c family protein